jgi:hypothetical protein
MRDTGPSSTLFRLPPLLLLAVPVDTKAQDTPSLERTAVEWMTLLMEGEFQRAAAQMSPTTSIPTDQIATFWPQLASRYGDLGRLGVINRITLNELETVQLLGYFDAGGETASHTIRVTLDTEGRPADFFILDG